MTASTPYPQGLTRVIFETLVSLTPEVVASGEHWSPELLDAVEQDVRRQLAPEGQGRQNLIFDMVFRRAFAEARDLMLQHAVLPAPGKAASRPPLQALA